MIEWTNQNARNALSEVQNLIMFLINLQPHKRTVKKQAKDPQSRTKLLENLYPFIHTIEHNNTTSTTTDLRYQIHLPPGQSCFLQMSKDQGCFRTHNNIASKGRGEGRTQYNEDVRKNALGMWHFPNSFVQDCRFLLFHNLNGFVT